MARRSTGKGSTSGSRDASASGSSRSERGTRQKGEAATKGAIREQFLRKKDELLKLKSLDIFLVKDALGTNPRKSDMKPELRGVVARLKSKRKQGKV